MTATRNASALIVACLLLVACTSAPAAPAASTSPTSAPAQSTAAPASLIHVKMATTAGATGNAPVYIAMARGYFQQQGIELETVDFPGGAQMIPAIAASQVDVASSTRLAYLVLTNDRHW